MMVCFLFLRGFLIGKWGVILQQANTDMIKGSIFKSILWFSIPLLIGNFFQQLYNTVDSYVVGNFVDTNALAAVGASGPMINLLLVLFVGISTGANVMVAQYFGAKRRSELSDTVGTVITLTLLASIIIMIVGPLLVPPFLRMVDTPVEIFDMTSSYLTIYFLGIAGMAYYNIIAGVLRGMGDSVMPLLFLMAACLTNIVLDLLFVAKFGWGVAGVAIATIIAQAVSSAMVMYKLMHTQEDYKLELRKIHFHKKMVKKIIAFGFPAALQQSITSFSNVIVQSYINRFGATAMAGYSATIRIDGFLQLPLQSFNMAITTFVGQNIGAKQYRRVKKGIWAAWVMSSLVILVGSVSMYFFAPYLIGVFTDDAQVIANGSGMLRIFSYAYIVLPVVQVLNGALRGAGLSKIPMYFMLGCFVVLRQIYLMVAVPMTNNLFVVMTGWPVTWVICAIGMLAYYLKADWLPEEAAQKKEVQ